MGLREGTTLTPSVQVCETRSESVCEAVVPGSPAPAPAPAPACRTVPRRVCRTQPSQQQRCQ